MYQITPPRPAGPLPPKGELLPPSGCAALPHGGEPVRFPSNGGGGPRSGREGSVHYNERTRLPPSPCGPSPPKGRTFTPPWGRTIKKSPPRGAFLGRKKLCVTEIFFGGGALFLSVPRGGHPRIPPFHIVFHTIWRITHCALRATHYQDTALASHQFDATDPNSPARSPE